MAKAIAGPQGLFGLEKIQCLVFQRNEIPMGSFKNSLLSEDNCTRFSNLYLQHVVNDVEFDDGLSSHNVVENRNIHIS